VPRPEIGDLARVSSPYTFVALTICIDAAQCVLLVCESRPDCRGKYYLPAGRGHPGEDPLAIAWRTTAEKTGIIIEPIGVLGVEHNPPIAQYPGQLRVFVLARATGGSVKVREDEHSMGAAFVPMQDVRGLKLRSDDFLPWLDDAALGQPVLPATSWRALGAGV
jgi:ADP-ribose pyrophosphatase YjhB (NUDIX family)